MTKENQRLEVTLLPQVNLLPPEEYFKRQRRLSAKISAGVAIVGILAVLGAGVWSEFRVQGATEALETETERGNSLRIEKQKYAEVPVVKEQLARAVIAEQAGMYPEINWKQYTDSLVATLPEGITLESLDVNHADILLEPEESTDSLIQTHPDRVGSITLVARSATYPDTVAWLRSFASIPGLIEPRVQSIQYDAINNTQESYLVTLTVDLTSEAYTGRFLNKNEAQQ